MRDPDMDDYPEGVASSDRTYPYIEYLDLNDYEYSGLYPTGDADGDWEFDDGEAWVHTGENDGDNRGHLAKQPTDTGDPKLNGNGDNVCFITLDSGMKELSADDVTDLMSCSLYNTPPSLHPGTSCDPAVCLTGKQHLYVDRDDMVVYTFEPDDALETSITFYLAFQCSTYAGDNYEIKAEVLDTSNAECGGSLPNTAVSGTVTVWRRYYVKLDGMQPTDDPNDVWYGIELHLPGGTLDEVKDVFRGGFADIQASFEVVDFIEENFVAPELLNPVDKWWD